MAAGDVVNWPDVAVRVASASLTANSATWTTTETGALITVTASLVSGWTYKIYASMFVQSTVAGDLGFMRIREDTSAGTQDVAGNVYIATTSGSGFPLTLYTEYTAAATASKTWVVTGSRGAGTGTQNISAGGSRPAWLTVDRVVS